jgi:hypothetical protein
VIQFGKEKSNSYGGIVSIDVIALTPLSYVNFLLSSIDQEILSVHRIDVIWNKRLILNYDCQYLFYGETFTEVLTGREVLYNSVYMNRVVFDRLGLQKSDLCVHDVYVKSGQFTSFVKKYLLDRNILKERKYGESNTFRRTFKLGFVLKSSHEGHRNVSYLKLTESLQLLKVVIQDQSLI